MQDLNSLKESVKNALEKYKELQGADVSHSANLNTYDKGDVKKEVTARSAFNKYRGLESDYLKKRWYGEQEENVKAVETKPEKGLVGRALEGLLIPSRAVTGAVKSVVGQGTEGDIGKEIVKNIETGDTMGTLLRNAGAPEVISMPLGFVLDIATDPLNIATAGTGTIVGKALLGARKAGVTGAAKGIEYGLKEGVGKTAAIIPGFNKTQIAGKAVEMALKSADEFDNKIGAAYLDRMMDKGVGTSAFENIFGTNAGENAKKSIMKTIDGVFGEGKSAGIGEFFEYSPAKWYKASKFIDEMEKVDDSFVKKLKEMPLNEREEAIGELLADVRTGNMESLASKISKSEVSKNEVSDKLRKEIDAAFKVAEESSDDISYLDGMSTSDRYGALSEEAVDEKWFKNAVSKILESKKEMYQTGFKAYDNLVDKVSNATLPFDVKIPEIAKKIGVKSTNLNQVKFGKQVIDTYSDLISLFKASKISVLSPGSVVNAVAGNPTMAHLAGINILDPDYITSIAKAKGFLGGKIDKEFVSDMFLAGDKSASTVAKAYPWIEFMKKYPRTFTATYGFTPEFFKYKYNLADKMDKAFKLGILKYGDEDELVKEMNSIFKEIDNAKPTATGEILKETINKNKKGFPTAYEHGDEWLNSGVRKLEGWETANKSLDYYTSFVANELGTANFERIRQSVAKKAAAGSRVNKFLSYVLNDAVNGYERVDQSFKLGLAYKLSSKGITESEMNTLKRFVNIIPEDITNRVKSGAAYKYTLSPERATEAVNYIYMNYNAMPAFVKFMRSLPLMGSPFFSFIYAMAEKTGKSYLMNPAAFNKVNFLMQEMNGAASPLEKASLDSEYNKYMKSEGMVRMPFPFFDRNPLYLNTINWVPYYMNNIFSGSEKTYEGQVPTELSKFLDSAPIMQDPAGQLIYNYFIQPMILDGEIPQGRFGQKVYPVDATNEEKLAYFTRDLAESFTPSMIALAAPVVPEEAINWLPNYHWRRVANAMKGRSVIGADAKDPAAERTIKAFSSVLGIPIYSPNLEYTEQEYK